MKTKILHVTGAMNMGGAEVMLMDIFRNISDQFHFDFLVNYNTIGGKVVGDFDKEILEREARIEYIGAQWDIGPFAYIKKFNELYIDLGSPEIVHIHMNSKSGMIALAASRAGARKVIVHSHANLKIRGSKIKVFLGKLEFRFQKWLMARYATDFWGCSNEANESLFYKRLLTPTKSAVINNAIDVQKFLSPDENKVKELRGSYKLKENTIVLGNVGRVVRHKNIGFVVKLLGWFKEQGHDMRFVFAGRHDDQEYISEFMTRARELGVLENIISLGSRKDIANVMHSFDVFVGPALQEGFGLVAVEAQAAGVPCVLYKGFPQSVDMQLELATFLDDFDADLWAETILKVQYSRNTDKTKIKNKIALLGFDIIDNTRKIEKLYLN